MVEALMVVALMVVAPMMKALMVVALMVAQLVDNGSEGKNYLKSGIFYSFYYLKQ